MKRYGFLAIISCILLSSALFGADNDKLKKDISTLLTHKRVDIKDINIIATDKLPDIKDLHMAIGTIKDSTKPFLILYNKSILIFGNMIDRKSGKSVFEEFIAKNRKKIKTALKEQKKRKKETEKANNKKLVSLLNGKYKDLVVSVKGGNPKGKTVYLITDPNCPFCKDYEEQRLAKTVKNSKEVKIVPIYLNIQGHETSPMRSSWFIQQAKNAKNGDILPLLHKASDEKDMSFKKVDKKEAQKLIKKMEQLMMSGLIEGTPTVIDEDGNSVR
ncbi:MAG: thioredoxin fold domain-containing protein [Epsilonproteobacteria bacterium]|nr:thioredoxin fold domain-containing protein [Campylobacterota bacterium]